MTALRTLPISQVYPNPNQPRKQFAADKLAELAESIRENGLMQPIKVCPDTSGRFMICCGERRYRAHLKLGRTTIEAIIENLSASALADQAIIENLQRLDITPMEEARAFQARLDDGLSVEELAKRLGVKARRIELRVMLLTLAPEYQDAFEKGLIEYMHAAQMSRLSTNYQRLLFAAIRSGQVKGPSAIRAAADALLVAERKAAAAPATFKLAQQAAEPEQRSMFVASDPSPQERATLTALERKIESVTDLVCGAFDDNELKVVARVHRTNAATMSDKLGLLEQHLRQMRLALLRNLAADHVTGAA